MAHSNITPKAFDLYLEGQRLFSVIERRHLEAAATHQAAAETQTAAAASGVHLADRAGSWPGTVGTSVPFGSLGVHVKAGVSHHSLGPQSASTAQPPGGTQTAPFTLQAPERQTTLASPWEQGPSPSA